MPAPFWIVSHRELRTSERVRLVFDALVAGTKGLDRRPAFA